MLHELIAYVIVDFLAEGLVSLFGGSGDSADEGGRPD